MPPPQPASDPAATTAAARRVAALARHVAGGGGSGGGVSAPPSVAAHPTAAPSSSSSAPPPADAASCPRTAGGPFRPDRLLDGQVAIITGAGQGLGAAAARLFAAHGAAVLVADLDGPKAEGVTAEIKAAGGTAVAFAGDVTDPAFAPACVGAALAAFGGQSIDILVNNAGYTWDGVVHRITGEAWDAMLAVHCTAPFRLIQAAAPYMRGAAKAEADGPAGRPRPRCIINVSSTSGAHGNAGQANYATAKAGVLGLTKTLAREWGGLGIRVNAVTYGFIATRLTGEKGEASMKVGGKEVPLGIPGGEAMAAAAAEMMIPLRRVGTPEEAAGAMLLLASPYASFISGQSLEVTGGAFI